MSSPAVSRTVRVRPEARLGHIVDKKLIAYAVAAYAAGAATLTPPAHAKIVYTPVNQPLTLNTQVYLDINHDGIDDVLFSNGSGVDEGGVSVHPIPPNSVRHAGLQNSRGILEYASYAGAQLGPKQRFHNGGHVMAGWNATNVLGYEQFFSFWP